MCEFEFGASTFLLRRLRFQNEIAFIYQTFAVHQAAESTIRKRIVFFVRDSYQTLQRQRFLPDGSFVAMKPQYARIIFADKTVSADSIIGHGPA